ncbi:hypothetical protein IIE18_12120 [Pseudomonas sp. V1]|uniref:hypothetical protein n=1 Tax=Pseudomonas arcuscaelestis TaxID=2710591 RepID=UPI00193F192A|nr:hypothetical protein [Pseudomonas arcuscaelestis]MBM3105884.1 hypothetical protein [Pseudomonas arcuscaelestis]
MGQANQRGSFAERLAQSNEAKRNAAEALGLVLRNLDDIRAELGVPQDAPFLGYLVHIPDSDEFLLEYKDTPQATSRSWTKNPGAGRRFADFAEAHMIARPDREMVVGLFETSTQFLIAEVL